jgi:hypothetical protein
MVRVGKWVNLFARAPVFLVAVIGAAVGGALISVTFDQAGES